MEGEEWWLVRQQHSLCLSVRSLVFETRRECICERLVRNGLPLGEMASGTAVADIIQRTLETLHSLYEEVGVEEENRTEDASALIAEFEKLCKAKIADIVDLKQETLEQLDREVEAIRFIAAELGIDAPKHVRPHCVSADVHVFNNLLRIRPPA